MKISEDDTGNHFGYGYITYYNQDDAKKAIDSAHGKKIWNSEIEITYFHYNKNHESHKIYLNNLPEKYTSEELKKLCEEIAPVQTCNIFFDHQGKLFGVVQYSNENDVKTACDKLNNKNIKDNIINVKIYQNKFHEYNKQKNYYGNNYYNNSYNNQIPNNYYPRNEPFQNCNLYVKNIPLTASDEDLKTIFGKYGTIKSLKLEKDENQKSKGYGYILYDNATSAKNAIEILGGKYLPGFESWTRPLVIEYFISKNNRQIMYNQIRAIGFYKQQDNQMIFPAPLPSQFPPMFIQIDMTPKYKNQYMNNQRYQHQNNYKNWYGYGRKIYNSGYHRGGRGGRGGYYKNNHYKNYNNEKNTPTENKKKIS